MRRSDTGKISYFNPLPLRRGRPRTYRQVTSSPYFNPLPLRRGRHLSTSPLPFSLYFNPLPLRRGRQQCERLEWEWRNISIHSLYAEGDDMRLPSAFGSGCISIHSLYAEGDMNNNNKEKLLWGFQSTPSTQRETDSLWRTRGGNRNFNPLPLRRGRHVRAGSGRSDYKFQSTPSTQRETHPHQSRHHL